MSGRRYIRPLPSDWARQRAEIVSAADRECPICSVEMWDPVWGTSGGMRSRATIDHIVPRCQSGADTPDNLRVICWGCNNRLASELHASMIGAVTFSRRLTPAARVRGHRKTGSSPWM